MVPHAFLNISTNRRSKSKKLTLLCQQKLNDKTVRNLGLSDMLQATEDLHCNCSVGVLSYVICWFIIKTQQHNFGTSCNCETKHSTATRA